MSPRIVVPRMIYDAVKAAAEAEATAARLEAIGVASQAEAREWLERLDAEPYVIERVEGVTPGGIHWRSVTPHEPKRGRR